jgi:hypothetical protein
VRPVLLLLALACSSALAAPRQVDEYHWTGVERIVAIGDLHGDYASYLAALQAAGLVDAKGKWTGGATHLVQTGDIPDRGPDTRRIITHMAKLAQEAAKKGGYVHNLMGNHEAMNVTGDLRYVSAGEYAAYADRKSAARRDRYYFTVMDALQRSEPEKYAALPADHRATWNAEHPLGWVEHRAAWDPRWNPKGAMFDWVMGEQVAIQINDLVFMHGGLSNKYCGNTLASMTSMARDKLRKADPADPGILEDPLGPLWYRGLSGVAPEAPSAIVDAVLATHGAKHLVVGHTPTGGAIWPRYDARVVMIDTGMSAAYGSHVGYLEATPQGLFAGYRTGKLPLPVDDGVRGDYLDAVLALHPGDADLKEELDKLRSAAPQAAPADAAAPALTCDISP